MRIWKSIFRWSAHGDLKRLVVFSCPLPLPSFHTFRNDVLISCSLCDFETPHSRRSFALGGSRFGVCIHSCQIIFGFSRPCCYVGLYFLLCKMRGLDLVIFKILSFHLYYFLLLICSWEPVSGMKAMSRMNGVQLLTFQIMIKWTFSLDIGKQDQTGSGINFTIIQSFDWTLSKRFFWIQFHPGLLAVWDA